MRLVAAGLAVMAVGLSGCATLRRGSTDQLPVISDPPGATVTTSLGLGCTTPCTLAVNRDAVFTATVSKAGFESRTVAVTTRIAASGAAIATENVATAGFGLAVDAATGAALEHVPDPINVTLRSLAGPAKRKTPPERLSHGKHVS